MGSSVNPPSDAASVLSGSTTYSYAKDAQPQQKPQDKKKGEASGKPPRRGMRQRVRDVMHDLGRPPTARQDAKDGRVTKNHIDVGPAGGAFLGGSAAV